MDIGRGFKRGTRNEFFRVRPGHQDNRIEVISIDKKIKQVVVMVHEPKRTFTTKEWDRKKRKVVLIKQTTYNVKRHLLCGLDERQLFIATLPRGLSSVRDAHTSLKTSTVTFAEGRASGRTIRQGEWFFVNITQEEEEAIKRRLKEKNGFIQKNVALSVLTKTTAGKPHVVDEAFVTPGRILQHGFSVRGIVRDEVYVRGKVKHRDHKTISFSSWRKVIRNNERGNGSGINWVD